ncbi:hypothetical protein BN14_09095 [Rhizoctonia solani AG-1 IB]|uniref:Uncharacterized protein n=1 Tax=Thanatephorus cucumeris (strain AG1-IB / isolate 7/3/14) TaxID=1108050 RepID=M5CFU6_THACB|nr:hypothetical protein BN14_09095 [Rhizoctonia solani AG-1 IB]
MLQMLGLLKKVKGEVKGEVNKEVVIDPEEGEDKQGGLRDGLNAYQRGQHARRERERRQQEERELQQINNELVIDAPLIPNNTPGDVGDLEEEVLEV